MTPRHPEPPAEGTGPIGPTPPPPTGAAVPPGRLTALCLAAGLLAALASWGLCESVRDRFDVPLVAAYGDAEAVAANARAIHAAQARLGALCFGGFGALIGLLMGLAGGLAAGAPRRGIAAGLLGLPLGAAAGAAAAFLLIPIFHQNVDRDSGDLIFPMLIHGGLWAPAAALAGLAFGFGLGGRPRAARGLMGGLLGALVGTMLYEVGGAIAFPVARTAEPLAATGAARLFGWITIALAVAACVAAASQDPKPKPRPKAPATPQANPNPSAG